MRVISGGSVVFVVFWGWNQGDISWRIRLVSAGNGSVDWFLCVGLVKQGGFQDFNRKVGSLCNVWVVGFGIIDIFGSGLRIMVVCLRIWPA